ncbi:unnamed protein product [Kuraishia capsulata CBS 1993]|uniref:Uncharacterized protein n=1 Tax=Kuraishia capsulata CBS 1993 TaxID=1382522 RepID=W6MXJ4_9ASCO|nr:uncharacterized protein KUCA_T00004981001 [Kuraishia capsulata CBS 1993]CDK28995.1 unnamed protein product [Kuraishia capsulata CBS 1993]
MAISTRQRRFAAFTAATAVVVGAGAVFLQTYPHLDPTEKIKAFLYSKLPSQANEESEDSALTESSYALPESSVEEWSEEDLRRFLEQKQVVAPEGAAVEELLALVKSLNV